MAHRFLYDLITIDQLTASDVAVGRVTSGTKIKSGGGADGVAGGVFTGTTEYQWMIDIDSITSGTSIGQATFRYSKDNGVTWTRSGILTSATAVTLELGVTFVFTAASSGADFALGDRWTFKTTLRYGPASLIQMQDRNQEWRSSTVTGTKIFSFDFGAAGRIIRALAILDHNFTAAASVVAKLGQTSPATLIQGSPAYHTKSMGLFFNGGSYEYGRVEITDAANTANYLSMSKLYLGNYLQLQGRRAYGTGVGAQGILGGSKASHLPWKGDEMVPYGEVSSSPHGYRRESIETKGRTIPLHYDRLGPTPYAQLIAMRDSVQDADIQRINRPLIFFPDHNNPWDARLCYLVEFKPEQPYPKKYTVDMTLLEVTRKAA